MINNRYKKILIVTGIIAFVLLGAGFIIFLVKNISKPTPSLVPTPTLSVPFVSSTPYIPIPTTISTDEIPEYTGADIEIPSSEEIRQSEQSFTLRQKLPIIQPQFDLTYDYHELIFNVTLREPIEINKNYFYTWLKDNGFGDIPIDNFNFR